MFRLHLHPSPSSFLFGIGLVAFWALLWLWFLAQLPRPVQSGDQAAPAVAWSKTVPG
jgi:hypothetical protein